MVVAKVEGRELSEFLKRAKAANLPPGHWFCHDCKGHFGRPVYDPDDEAMFYICPACGSPAIEDETRIRKAA